MAADAPWRALTLRFAAAPHESTIVFGCGCAAGAARAAAERFPGHRVAIIADATVGRLHGAAMAARFADAAARADLFLFPPGEASKSREQKARLEDALFAGGFGRDTVVVALGGGVTGDLAGFVAATFCRGVPCIQIPTTLLAMTDSSIGGKTGVDVPAGKNLVGAFHQPALVCIDPTLLATLPDRELRAGLVETIKHGAIADRGLLETVDRNLVALCAPAANGEIVDGVLFRSCSVKARVVERDEREGGARQILNFGHTVGHALEHLSGWRLLHGEAVSLGMVAAAHLSVALCGLPAADARALEDVLRRLGTPTRWEFLAAAALERMRSDKKARAGAVRFVLLERLGAAAGPGSVEVSEAEILKALTAIGGQA